MEITHNLQIYVPEPVDVSEFAQGYKFFIPLSITLGLFQSACSSISHFSRFCKRLGYCCCYVVLIITKWLSIWLANFPAKSYLWQIFIYQNSFVSLCTFSDPILTSCYVSFLSFPCIVVFSSDVTGFYVFCCCFFIYSVCVAIYIYIHVQKGSKMFTDIILLQENDSKRARALKKAAEEREMRRAKDREIAR